MRQGPCSFISSRRTSPGLVAFSSSAWTRRNAFLPPSCQASSPHSVRTTVPSGLVTGFPGEILFPTITTRFTAGQIPAPASFSTAAVPRSTAGGAAGEGVVEPQHRVGLPPAEVGGDLHPGAAPLPAEPPHGAREEPRQAL